MKDTLQRSFAVLAAAGMIAACGTEPSATLVIVLNNVPPFAVATSITISGLVTRTPEKETTISVTASGGSAQAVDTAAANGSFSVTVRLNLGTRNDIVLTAQDATGSASAPVTVTVVQDGSAPTVVSATPSGDGVTTTPTMIEVLFNEPVVLGGVGAGIQLVSHDEAVPGTSVLSSDSLTLTFAPQTALVQNSVYQMELSQVTDPAGNVATPSATSCFVTELTAPAQVVESDSTDDLFVGGSGVGVSPADLVELRLAAHDGLLSGVLEFTTPRSFDSTATNNAYAWLELDTDQDSTTGFVTLKDTIFNPLFPELSSGTGAEYVIGLEPSSVPGTAYVGMYTAALNFDVLDTFMPDFCGEFMGFATSFTNLGGDDGNMNYVLLTVNIEGDSGSSLDPTPTGGHNSLAFAGLFAPAARADAALVQRRSVRLRPPRSARRR